MSDELYDIGDVRQVGATILACALERATDGFDDLRRADGFDEKVEGAATKGADCRFE